VSITADALDIHTTPAALHAYLLKHLPADVAACLPSSPASLVLVETQKWRYQTRIGSLVGEATRVGVCIHTAPRIASSASASDGSSFSTLSSRDTSTPSARDTSTPISRPADNHSSSSASSAAAAAATAAAATTRLDPDALFHTSPVTMYQSLAIEGTRDPETLVAAVRDAGVEAQVRADALCVGGYPAFVHLVASLV
jgi:hypothetical protein